MGYEEKTVNLGGEKEKYNLRLVKFRISVRAHFTTLPLLLVQTLSAISKFYLDINSELLRTDTFGSFL